MKVRVRRSAGRDPVGGADRRAARQAATERGRDGTELEARSERLRTRRD